MTRRRLVATGGVQGICYRDWFVGEARALGLVGWVRNRTDGSVEAVVEGPVDCVETMIANARRGSPAARVADVRIDDGAPAETLEGFVRRPTA